MEKVDRESSHVHGVHAEVLQRTPVSEPALGSDFDRRIARLAAKKGKKPSKYKKPGYPPKKKKKPAKKK